MSECVILIPVLGRPELIDPLLESIYSTAPDVAVLFLTTPADEEGTQAVAKTGERYARIQRKPKGDYARKINMGYAITKEPVLFMGATDLKFHEGWLEAGLAMIGDGIHAVGTNDLGNPRVMLGQHSTHTFVTREYVDKFGTIDEERKILHESYPHEYCDDEFVETAKARNAYRFCMDSVVEHMHPAWGKAEWDDSYLETDNRVRSGYKIFRRRVPLWMQLSS
jgi:glycosyltransferase involved in cell wall biosynthesis